MRKLETIPFDTFVTGTYKQAVSKRLVYSFISPIVFFDGGTMLIIGAGIVAAGLALWENHAVRQGDITKADFISLLGNMLLQGGGIALAVYLFSTMVFGRWL